MKELKELKEIIEKMPDGEKKDKVLKALAIAEVIINQAERVAKICETDLSDADKFELALTGEVTRRQIKTIIETPLRKYPKGGVTIYDVDMSNHVDFVKQGYNEWVFNIKDKNIFMMTFCNHEFTVCDENGVTNISGDVNGAAHAICRKCGYRP